MNFTSQICTTKEQSKRLLALGLKKDTADMMYVVLVKDFLGRDVPDAEKVYSLCTWYEETSMRVGLEKREYIPAWSLHRLIELLPQWIDTTETSLKLTIDQGKLVCYRGIFDEVQTFIFGRTSLYDSIIDIIEKLIKGGYFNKEYLTE